jgi:hypothetical protein
MSASVHEWYFVTSCFMNAESCAALRASRNVHEPAQRLAAVA